MALKTLSGDSESENSAIMAEINITPLTDIFLVLLIIFMVTSSVMSQMGVNVNLPKASHAIAQAQSEGVILTLGPSGQVSVNQLAVSLEGNAFEKALADAFAKSREKLIVLEGDQKTWLGSAIEVMDRAKKAGAEKFAIATVPAEK